ncbi:MAG: hypothetical protein VX083_16050 [Pseudomonadota bacterium]|nr:hypothetical protein [Pseudomonadota bacterium]MEC8295006.1 hypothetical protein [Pseudomonadota bacterium]
MHVDRQDIQNARFYFIWRACPTLIGLWLTAQLFLPNTSHSLGASLALHYSFLLCFLTLMFLNKGALALLAGLQPRLPIQAMKYFGLAFGIFYALTGWEYLNFEKLRPFLFLTSSLYFSVHAVGIITALLKPAEAALVVKLLKQQRNR